MQSYSIAGRVFLLAVTLIVSFSTSAIAQKAPEKASPFTAVRWEGEEPMVRFEGDWYLFESIDGHSKAAILSHAKEEHGRRWQKRFSEDLVEILGEMGHEPNVTVQLVLNKDGNSVKKQGQMTEDNRRSVRDYNDEPDDQIAQGGRITVKEPGSQSSGVVEVTSEDTPANQKIARQYAEYIDTLWDQSPSEGNAHLRFLIHKDGKLYAGPLTLHTEFTFTATGRRGQYLTQGFNSNQNGRWVYEDLKAGTYDIVINGAGPFEGWSWTKTGVEIKEGTSPIFEIEVNK